MIAFERGLIAYTERYLLGRSVCADYAATLRARIERFCEWAGADLTVDSLSCDLVNEWLAELDAAGMNKWTLDSYRRSVLSIWNDAYHSGENDNAPLRLRSVKKPRLIIEAYTHAELKSLLRAASALKQIYPDGNKASVFWQATIHVAYSCGARRGDVLKLEWRHVAPDGLLTFLQSKTQYAHTVKLSRKAIRFGKKLGDDKLVLPWCYERNWFGECFTRLKKAAGVKRGTFKWIRRSAGSYAESRQPGAGGRLLGHRDERMFRRHYDDPSISGKKAIEPPAL